eukprot:scaffold30.g4432.t1
MASTGDADNKVTPYELAVLVLHFLQTTGCGKAAAAYRRSMRLVDSSRVTDVEAKAQLRTAVSALPSGVKCLTEVLNEYVEIKEREDRRRQLHDANPLAASLYSMLDHHAGLPVPQTLPPAFYGPPAAAQQHAQMLGMVPQQQAMHPDAYAAEAAGLARRQAAAQQQQAALAEAYRQQQEQAATPGRHGPRKGAAPRKRRKLDAGAGDGGVAAPDVTAGHGGGAAGPRPLPPTLDLLNMQAGGCWLAESVRPCWRLAALSALRRGGAPGLVQCLMRAVAGRNAGALFLILASSSLPPCVSYPSSPMKMNEDALANLLEDSSLQVQFAGSLAQSINARMGLLHGHHQPGGGGAGGSGSPPAHDSSPNDDSLDGFMLGVDELLAGLPADPQLASLLQQVVRMDSSVPPSPLQSQPSPGSPGATEQEAAVPLSEGPAAPAATQEQEQQEGREPSPAGRQQPEQPGRAQRGPVERVGAGLRTRAQAGAQRAPDSLPPGSGSKESLVDKENRQQQRQQQVAPAARACGGDAHPPACSPPAGRKQSNGSQQEQRRPQQLQQPAAPEAAATAAPAPSGGKKAGGGLDLRSELASVGLGDISLLNVDDLIDDDLLGD